MQHREPDSIQARRHAAAIESPLQKQSLIMLARVTIKEKPRLSFRPRMHASITPAEAHLRNQLSNDPNNGALAFQLGELLRQRGNLAHAEIHARNAVRLLPESPEAHRLLGLVLGQSHRNAASEVHLRRAAALGPPDGVLLASLGVNLSGQGRYEQASEFFRQASELEPQNIRFLLAWANSAELDGNCEHAEELINKAESIEAGSIEAVLLRSDVLIRQKNYAQAISLLDAHRERGESSPTQGTSFGLRRGRVLDRLQRYDEAFEACAKAKLHHYEQTGARYQRDVAQKFFDRSQRFFTRERLHLLPKATCREAEPQPLFVVGFPRSGTTLAESILASHKDVTAGGELFVIDRICAVSQDVLRGPLHYPECLIEALMGDRTWAYNILRDLYLQESQAHGIPKQGPRYFTDKTPFNGPHLGLISLLFPQSPIIHLLRHPLDSVLSCFFNQMGHGYDMANDLTTAAEHYVKVADLIYHYRKQFDLNYLPVRYEDIVAEQEGQTRKLLNFAGLDWDTNCLAFHRNSSGIRTASYAQVTDELYSRSVGRYRHYRKHLEPVIPILRPVIERMGYTIED
jgi:Flp pilus assembly protein TadD